MKKIIFAITFLVCHAAFTDVSAQELPKCLNVAYSGQEKLDGCHINTLEHFEAAADAGYNALKADMQMTKDGVIILCHDNGFTFDGQGRICKFDKKNMTPISGLEWKEIRKMEYSTGRARRGSYPKVATLEEFTRLCQKKGVYMYITVRNFNQKATLKEALRIVDKYGMRSRCIFNNYKADDGTCSMIRELCTDVPISYTTTPKQEITPRMLEGIAKFAPIMLCVNREHIGDITPEMFEFAASGGIRLLGWYPSSAEEYACWLSKGFNGAQIINVKPL